MLPDDIVNRCYVMLQGFTTAWQPDVSFADIANKAIEDEGKATLYSVHLVYFRFLEIFFVTLKL